MLISIIFLFSIYSQLTHVTYVVLVNNVGLFQACLGTWTWDKVLKHMASSMNPGSGGLDEGMTEEQIDNVFKTIDVDGSGTIDADELQVALEKMGMSVTPKCVANMLKVVDENGDGVVDRLEFHTLVHIATARARHKKEKKESRKSTINSLKASVTLKGSVMGGRPPSMNFEDSERSGNDESFAQTTERAGNNVSSVPEEVEAMEEEESTPKMSPKKGNPLPRTYQEALPAESQAGNIDVDERAIVVTEAKHPFQVVGCNKPWEDLCGFTEKEAVGAPMSTLIQGPKTNREGLKEAMDDLIGGADYVECNTINYRKDGSAFHNFLQMGPLYDENDGIDEENGEREVAYFVGILKNIGELAQSMSGEDWEENKEAL